MLTQRSVVPDLCDVSTTFDPANARDVLYRRAWLAARVQFISQQDPVTNDQGIFYNCIDLIAAAIPTSRRNVNDKLWPRLLIAIEGNESSNPFVNHLRQNWDQVSFHNDDGNVFRCTFVSINHEKNAKVLVLHRLDDNS